MIGFYDYTVILTYVGFLSGLFGIIMAMNGNILFSVLCLMISGLCDMFDGKVARTKKKRTNEEKHFGIQLDSLSDLVCFGVLPAIIGYKIGMNKCYFIPIILLYPLAALIRLAYFNVLEIIRNSNTPVKEYVGLPVTSSALVFPFLFVFRKLLGSNFIILYASFLVLIGFLFISKIKIKKPQTKHMILLIVIGVIELLLIITVRRFL